MAVANRTAYTLVELVMSMTAASVLMGGLAASLFLTLEAFEGQPAALTAAEAGSVQAELLRDLGRATSFTTRTADTVTFTVPDEDNDGAEETLSYSYDSDAGTLSMTSRGFTANVLTGVTGSTFTFLGRDRTGSAPTPSPYDVNDWGMRWYDGVEFQEFTETKEGSGTMNSMAMATPPGAAEGDLLIAAVAYDKYPLPTVPSGWTEVTTLDSGGRVSTLVCWKLVGASEPASHTFNWEWNARAYGVIMRFTGHDPSSPIHAFAANASTSPSPASPAVTTGVDGCMILRLGAFDGDSITVDETGLAAGADITMDASDTGNFSASGGAGYSFLASAGDSGTDSFQLSAGQEYVTVTIAIAPQ